MESEEHVGDSKVKCKPILMVNNAEVDITDEEEVHEDETDAGNTGTTEETSSDTTGQKDDETDAGFTAIFRGTGSLFQKGKQSPRLSTEEEVIPVFEEGWLKDNARVNKNDKYGITGEDRGLCLIFDNDKFNPELRMNDRRGSSQDQQLAKNMFEELGFEVKIYKNKTKKQIKDALQDCADEDHENADALAVVMMSHGEEGIIFAKDQRYPVESVWEPFTADKCPALMGKPKLFFIQACQGSKFDEGRVSVGARTSVDNFASYKTPQHADFLLAHSTINGFFAWRNTAEGSWFIQALVAAISANKKDKDLLTIMTKTTELVTKFESRSSKSQFNRKKQTPFVYSTLTKKLYLTHA